MVANKVRSYMLIRLLLFGEIEKVIVEGSKTMKDTKGVRSFIVAVYSKDKP